MTKYEITGGTPLNGTVGISGANNAAVAIIPAALLVDGICKIENVPDISDVRLLLQILSDMGANVRRFGPNTIELDCSRVRNAVAPIELVHPAAVTLVSVPLISISKGSKPWVPASI